MSSDMTIANFVLGVVGALAGGIGAYAAVRSELAHLKAVAEFAMEQAKRANSRIDDFFDRK